MMLLVNTEVISVSFEQSFSSIKNGPSTNISVPGTYCWAPPIKSIQQTTLEGMSLCADTVDGDTWPIFRIAGGILSRNCVAVSFALRVQLANMRS